MPKGGIRINSGRKQKLAEKLEITKRLTKTEDDFIEFARFKNLNLKDIKKMFLVAVTVFVLCMPGYSQTLKGGVEYTVDNARIVAFDNSPMRISKDEFKANLNDPFFYSNTGFLKGAISEAIAGKVVPFYEKGKLSFYGVQYHADKSKKYYYSPSGKLLKYEVNTFKGEYPYKTLAYDTQGKLLNINLVVSSQESFLFDSNKNLIGHWINNQFYNLKGEKDITRRL